MQSLSSWFSLRSIATEATYENDNNNLNNNNDNGLVVHVNVHHMVDDSTACSSSSYKADNLSFLFSNSHHGVDNCCCHYYNCHGNDSTLQDNVFRSRQYMQEEDCSSSAMVLIKILRGIKGVARRLLLSWNNDHPSCHANNNQNYSYSLGTVLSVTFLALLIGIAVGLRLGTRGGEASSKQQQQAQAQQSAKTIASPSSSPYRHQISVWTSNAAWWVFLFITTWLHTLALRIATIGMTVMTRVTQPQPLQQQSQPRQVVTTANDDDNLSSDTQQPPQPDSNTHSSSSMNNLPQHLLPRHVAVIMDGNRRYGRQHCGGSAARGHVKGGEKVMEWAQWCLDAGILETTLFAFSTENWQRDATEVHALLQLFEQHLSQLLTEAPKRGICVQFWVTDPQPLPDSMLQAMETLQTATGHCRQLKLNVCLSYGSQQEVAQACQTLATECVQGQRTLEDITVKALDQCLQQRASSGWWQPSRSRGSSTTNDDFHNTSTTNPVDILIRTSGEVRLSNFLLWQVAYAELFFVQKTWPEWTRPDFEQLLQTYVHKRQRRFGK